jgi:hypothetical protein
MIRFALGAKCGRSGNPCSDAIAFERAGWSKVAKAALPSPAPVDRKNSLRFATSSLRVRNMMRS